MKNLHVERMYLDGMWLKREQALQLAMNCGSFTLAEHYLCALLADAVAKGRREVLTEINQVRGHYGVKAIPVTDDDLKDDSRMNGRTRLSAADEQARELFLQMTVEEKIKLLRSGMQRLLDDYQLFKFASHWLAVYMVVRDRLLGDDINKTAFLKLAKEITPEGLPKKLHFDENVRKNLGREIDEEDRGLEYYNMKRNPQKKLCDTFWDIVKYMILA